MLLSPLDLPRAPQPETPPARYLLEYSDICNLMEWSVGDGTYQVGYGEDFTALAVAAVERERDCLVETLCDVRPGWCLDRDNDDAHRHPLAAALHHPGEIPLDYSETYEHRCEYLDAAMASRWDSLAAFIIEARHWALEHIEQVLDTALVGGDAAIAALQLAGFGIGDGLHSRANLHAAFRMHAIELRDRQLRNAFADWVVLHLARHLADQAPVMGRLWDELINFEEDDVPVLDPDELQWLAFGCDQFPLAGGEAGRLLDTWTATGSQYRSLFDEAFEQTRSGYPLAVAWREIDMVRHRSL